MGKFLNIAAIVCFFLCVSCEQKNQIEIQSISFDNENWIRFNTPKFNYKIEDTKSLYDIYFFCDINKKVELVPDDIRFNAVLYTPDDTRRVNTYNFSFKNPGTKVKITEENSISHYEYPLRKDFKITKKGDLSIKIENRTSKYNNLGFVKTGVKLVRKK
ncbi:MAG: hypothetical protein ACEPOW_00340 [Bacteroidales bacterium]